MRAYWIVSVSVRFVHRDLMPSRPRYEVCSRPWWRECISEPATERPTTIRQPDIFVGAAKPCGHSNCRQARSVDDTNAAGNLDVLVPDNCAAHGQFEDISSVLLQSTLPAPQYSILFRVRTKRIFAGLRWSSQLIRPFAEQGTFPANAVMA